jgi:hypothetical protein
MVGLIHSSALRSARVDGLQGCEYRDSLEGRVAKTETAPAVRFEGEVDRIYVSTAPKLTVRPALGCAIGRGGRQSLHQHAAPTAHGEAGFGRCQLSQMKTVTNTI